MTDLSAALADRYVIEREIGRGGMATVYLAQDRRHDRLVALKVLAPESSASVGVQRFQQEIRVAARLSHPHILPLYDSGEVDGRLFYVMPYVEGESLRARIDREGALPVADAMRIAREVAEGLAVAHAQGVVHRDIKPENILLAGGHAVIADFGVARAASLGDATRLTEIGMAIGTPAYMSPEQGIGESDARSDVYALGCVLYEMLAGTTPWRAATIQGLMAQKMAGTFAPVTTVRDAVPPRIEALLARMLARHAADRPQTAQEVATALEGSPASPVASQADLTAVAVLPFVNMSADAENEFFSDGIAEELINVLAQIQELRVAARTSSFAFKGQNIPIRGIGQQLGVGVILEGSVRRSGDRVRITAQLIKVEDGYHLWSDRFDRKVEDVFAIQDEIANAIAGVLRVKLLGEATTQRHTTNAEAYQCYLRGRHLWNQDNSNAGRALEWYQKAVELAPDYALPYAGMVDCYCTVGAFMLSPPQPMREAGMAMARKALALSPNVPEVRFSYGYMKFYMEWDWDGAEREFRLAQTMNPNYEQPSLFLSLLLAARGRWAEAEVEAARGRAADPLSGFAHFIAAQTAYFGRDFERAVRGLREAVELSPGLANPLWTMSGSLSWLGRHEEAIAIAERLVEMSGRLPVFVGTLGGILNRAGRQNDALAIEAELQARSETEYVSPLTMSALAADLGRTEEALDHLVEAIEERNFLMWALPMVPTYDAMRDHPRFQALIGSLGL